MRKRITEKDDISIDYSSRSLTAWSVLAGLLLFGVLAGPFFAGRIYTADDLGEFHLPIRAFYAQQLAVDQSYDWMPQLFSGFYLTGEGQGGAYHPLHQLLYRVFPLQVALGLEYLVPYPLMMLGMWLMLKRRLGRNDAAMFGGLVFTFSSFNLLHFVHPNAVAVVAHIPWLLWAIDIVLTDMQRRRVALALVLIALLTGSQLLLGYPQFVWFSLVAEGFYAIFLLIAALPSPFGRGAGSEGETSSRSITLTPAVSRREREPYAKRTCRDCIGRTPSTWPRVVIAKGIGLLIGGIQLLPSLDALLHSARQASDATFNTWGSLHPWNVLQLVAPYAFSDRVIGGNTHEFSMYISVVPLTLIAWLIFRRHQWGPAKPLVWAALIFAAAALLLAFGGLGPLYGVTTRLPLLSHFRFPTRYLVLFQLAAAVLAAVGFSVLARETATTRQQRAATPSVKNRRTWKFLWRKYEPLWCLMGISLAVAIAGLVLHRPPYGDSTLAMLAGPILITLAALLVVAATRGHAIALVGLVLLAAGDLGCYGMSYAVYRGDFTIMQYVASIKTPPGDPDGRVVASLLRFDQPGLRVGDAMTLRGWRRADGYAGLEPRQRLDYRQLPALRVAGVRWIKRNESTATLVGLKPFDDNWLEVPDPLPRVRLVSKTLATTDPAIDLAQISPDTTALCEIPLDLPASMPGTATLRSENAGRMEIDVDCPASQLLVVAESFHPGWRAAIDAQPQQVYRINGDFMGCIVGPGRHRVTLCFQPSSLKTGQLTSCLGLGMLAICFIGLTFAPKPRVWKEDLQ